MATLPPGSWDESHNGWWALDGYWSIDIKLKPDNPIDLCITVRLILINDCKYGEACLSSYRLVDDILVPISTLASGGFYSGLKPIMRDPPRNANDVVDIVNETGKELIQKLNL